MAPRTSPPSDVPSIRSVPPTASAEAQRARRSIDLAALERLERALGGVTMLQQPDHSRSSPTKAFVTEAPTSASEREVLREWTPPHPIGATVPGALSDERSDSAADRLSGAATDAHDLHVSRKSAYDVPRLAPGVVLQWPVRFHASGRDYARLWLGHVFLMCLTLGLAWPWVVQRREQFFLRQTHVAGHQLDFRLNAIAIWPRCAFGLSLLLGVAGAALGSTLAGLAALTLAAVAWPLLSYLRINQQVAALTWAGRRLWFEGELQGVYRAWSGSLLLALAGVWLTAVAWDPSMVVPWWWAATCWFAWVLTAPLAAWALLKYRQQHVRLGPFQLLWKVSRTEYVRACASSFSWGTGVLLVVGGVLFVVFALVLMRARMMGQSALPARTLWAMVGVWIFVTAGLVWPHVHAQMTNLVWNKTGNRHLRFRSSLSPRGYTTQFFKNALRMLVTFGLYWPWAVVNLRRQRMQALQVWSRVDRDVLLAHWPTHTHDQAPDAVSPVSVLTPEPSSASPLVAAQGLQRIRA